MVSRQSGLRSDLPQFALPKGLLEAAEIRSDEDFNEVPDHGGTITKGEVVVKAADGEPKIVVKKGKK